MVRKHDNLTGGQVQQVLDLLIQQALFPIIRSSSLFDEQASYLMFQASTNKKRKVSALPAKEFISLMCQYLETTDTVKKCAIFSIAKIDRGFAYNFVVEMIEVLKLALPIYQKYLVCTQPFAKDQLLKRLTVISKSTGIPVDDMYMVYYQSVEYLNLMYTFRNTIVMQYEKLAHSMAKKICAQSNTYDHQDLVSNLIMAVVKAIDKYDCSKGALTSYVKLWMKNAKTSSKGHGHEYGVAYSIPALQRKALAISHNKISSNYGISLSSLTQEGSDMEIASSGLSIDLQLEQEQEDSVFLKLAKRADIKGLARLYLGIDEFFFPEELEQMRISMKNVKL